VPLEIEILADPDSVAERAASFVAEQADAAVAGRGSFSRLTLTYPALNNARQVLWLVTGTDKVEALRRLRTGDHVIPAGRVEAASQLVIADEAAVAGAEATAR
jgi:6-phosphogluconolactonase/glucosamine-6-phosphate isomerase/deaminase